MEKWKDIEARDRGDVFVRAIILLCTLGALWLIVAVAYAAWLGMFG
jgi:hypothetical protein